jgi:hypothetical protein
MPIRTVLAAALIALMIGACGKAPQINAKPGVAAVPTGDRSAVESASSGRPEITPKQIVQDVVGRVIKVSEMSGRWPPTEWTFEADEYKQADIVEKRLSDNTYTVVVFMTTHNNHSFEQDDVQVSGKLQFVYEWRGDRWALKRIDNLTFRYSLGQSV